MPVQARVFPPTASTTKLPKARIRHWILRTGLARFTMATSLVALCWLGPQIFMLGNVPGEAGVS